MQELADLKGYKGIEQAAVKAYRNMSQGAKEASDAAKEHAQKVVEALKEVQKVQEEIENLNVERAKNNTEYATSVAEAYVKQEEKVADKKKELADKDKEITESQAEVARESSNESSRQKLTDLQTERNAILETLKTEEKVLAERKTIELAFSNEVAEVRRFNALTEFEQELESLNQKKILSDLELDNKLNKLRIEMEAKAKQVLELIGQETSFTTAAIKESNTRTNASVENINREISAYNQLALAKSKATGVSYGGGVAPIAVTNTPSTNSGSTVINVTGNTILDNRTVEVVTDRIMDKLRLNVKLAL
jgi:hypothetical protein